MRSLIFWAITGLSILCLSLPTKAAVTIQPYLSGFSSPLFLTNAKDGSKRIFVVQRGGIIKVIANGSTASTNFLDITSKVLSNAGEYGLLGLAFHPQFATNGYFFVNYTRTSDGATIIARYKTTDATNAVGDPNSERILMTIAQPFSNHNGGMIEFRTDGGVNNLYIGMGDGGDANDPGARAQNINVLLGKFLRITPDVSGNNANPAYTVPADNPFAGATAGADEIYAVGMRNPFRWSFDRSTKQLWAADVGQGTIEEIDVITNGANYGWRVYEGTQCTNNDPALCNPANYTAPVFQYGHTAGRCSITGGYVYRGALNTLPAGAYTFGDYCTGEVWMLLNGTQTLLQDTTRNVSSFGEDEDGEIYVVGLGGTVDKILITTAADAQLSGRVVSATNRGLSGALIKLTDSHGNVRTARTNAFGYFNVADLPTGEFYVVAISAKSYEFAAQTINLTENLSNLIFTAQR